MDCAEGKELIEILCQIEDPRKPRGVRYRFADLLFICLYAVLAGHSEASEIAFYAELNFAYFQEVTGIGRVPSHDTFSRVLRMVSMEGLSESLGKWLEESYPDISRRYSGKRVLHIDGKAVRAAAEKSNGEAPRYLLNAMYEGESIGLKLREVGEKENEVSSLPEYLKLFELKDTIVTMDAIGCNNTVVSAITGAGGEYMLPVKENQKALLSAIEEKERGLRETGGYGKLDRAEQTIKDHGRMETYRASMIKDTSFIYEKLGLRSFYGTVARVMIIEKESIRKEGGKEKRESTKQYVVTSLESVSVEELLKIKQAHWNIEMKHWLLDVQLKEDGKTARKGNAMANGAALRRFCLMMKEQDSQYCQKPMKRFLMANEHDIHRIEQILFSHREVKNDAADRA